MLSTPIGTVIVEGNAEAITAIRIVSVHTPARRGTAAAVVEAHDQLAAWFAGRLRVFDLPLTPARSPRSAALRAGIVAIGYGESESYGALARQLGSGARAIGQACARNPFPLVVPCHRVLAAGGALGAYSAGEGPLTKRWLLDHEQRHRAA